MLVACVLLSVWGGVEGGAVGEEGLGDVQWRSEMDGGTSAVCWSLSLGFMERRWEDILVMSFGGEYGGGGGSQVVKFNDGRTGEVSRLKLCV